MAKRSTLSAVVGSFSVVAGGFGMRSVTMTLLELMASFKGRGFIDFVRQTTSCKCVAIHLRISP